MFVCMAFAVPAGCVRVSVSGLCSPLFTVLPQAAPGERGGAEHVAHCQASPEHQEHAATAQHHERLSQGGEDMGGPIQGVFAQGAHVGSWEVVVLGVTLVRLFPVPYLAVVHLECCSLGCQGDG